jgi:hypothetical protein
MEQCPVCGRTYGVTHSCPGPPAADSAVAAKWVAPAGFAPLHYFRQALAIARLDDGAVVAASRDRSAIVYGVLIWIFGQLFIFASSWWTRDTKSARVSLPVLLFALVFLVLLDMIFVLAQYGLCHLLARWWFRARGTYAGVLRPLLLGSVVTWLGIIPFVGIMIAGLWGIAVMMIVFEDVDGIGRLKAFGLSAAIGVTTQVLMIGLFAPR